MSSKKGKKAKKLRVYDLSQRAIIDRDITNKAINYIKNASRNNKPFFAISLTQLPITR